MTVIELEKRVAELEAEVAKLKAAQPGHVIHSHYHYAQPLYAPQPTWGPCYPQIYYGGQGTTIGAGSSG